MRLKTRGETSSRDRRRTGSKSFRLHRKKGEREDVGGPPEVNFFLVTQEYPLLGESRVTRLGETESVNPQKIILKFFQRDEEKAGRRQNNRSPDFRGMITLSNEEHKEIHRPQTHPNPKGPER